VPSSMPGEDPADLTAPEWIQDWWSQ
jgi:hypothetical protein